MKTNEKYKKIYICKYIKIFKQIYENINISAPGRPRPQGSVPRSSPKASCLAYRGIVDSLRAAELITTGPRQRHDKVTTEFVACRF